MVLTAFFFAALLLQSGTGGFPAVAAESGTIHVVWQDDSEGNQEIYYSRSNASGSFTKPLNVSQNPGISDLPRVVAHENSVSIVWSDTSSGKYQVLLAQSEDRGNTFGTARVLSDGMATTGPPDLAWQDGRLFAAWDETENDGETRIVFWDSNGGRRTIAGGNGGLVPAIAVRGRRVLVAWHTDIDYKQRVYASASDDFGASFSAPALLSSDFQRSVTPSVSIAPNGRSFIAWSDRTSGRSDLFLSSSDDQGRNYSAPKRIESSARESIFPDIEVMDNGEIAIVWSARTSIYYARISAAGETKETARLLTTYDTAGVPRLALDAESPIVVWKDFRDGRSQIFLSKDKAAGKALF